MTDAHSNPPIQMNPHALDRIQSVVDRLGVDHQWALNTALDYFDGLVEATITEQQDVCYLDDTGNPKSVSQQIYNIVNKQPVDIPDIEIESSQFSSSELTPQTETLATLNRLSDKLNRSHDEIINFAAFFFSSLVSLTDDGKNIAYTDYSDESDVSFSDQLRPLLQQAKAQARLDELIDPETLAQNAANNNQPPNASPDEIMTHVGEEMYGHIKELASELEIAPEMVLDGALKLYSHLVTHVDAHMDPTYLETNEQGAQETVSMGATFAAREFTAIHSPNVLRTPEDESQAETRMHALHVYGEAIGDFEQAQNMVGLSNDEVIHRAVDFMTEVLRCKRQDIALIAWDEQSDAKIDYVELLDEWANSMRLICAANATTPPEGELSEADKEAEQWISEFEERILNELQAGVPSEFGAQLAMSFEDRADSLALSNLPDDEALIQAFLETRIIKQQYLQHIGQDRQWSDDYFNGIVATAQEHVERGFGELIEEMIEEIERGATPEELVEYAKHEPAKLPAKALLSSVPKNTPHDGEHQGMIESQHIAIA